MKAYKDTDITVVYQLSGKEVTSGMQAYYDFILSVMARTEVLTDNDSVLL